MAYKYYDAYQKFVQSPQNTHRENFQQLVYSQFENASDIYTIQEEYPFHSGKYRNVTVRINRMIDAATGKNMPDDFKRILFRDIDHPIMLGQMYFFDNNYWLAFNIDKLKTLNSAVSVKRCNNSLRFIDMNGGHHSLPCVIDSLIKENRDYSSAGSSVVVPSGAIDILVQYNEESNLIRPNQRFLFGSPGNWTAYKVPGGGIGNFNNMETLNNTSQGIIRLTGDTNYINEATDNLQLGIADYYQNVYTIEFTDASVEGVTNQELQLIPIVRNNGIQVTRELVWESDNVFIASVTDDGLLHFKNVGACTIRCSLKNNAFVVGTCAVTVSATPVSNYMVIVFPNENQILEGEAKTYQAHVYLNGVQTSESFSFTLSNNLVPIENYRWNVLNGNTFTVANDKMYTKGTLDIVCTPVVHSTLAQTVSVFLRGVW